MAKKEKKKISLFYDTDIPEQKEVYDVFMSVGRKKSLLAMKAVRCYMNSGTDKEKYRETEKTGINDKQESCRNEKMEKNRAADIPEVRLEEGKQNEDSRDKSSGELAEGIGTSYKNMIFNSLSSFGN